MRFTVTWDRDARDQLAIIWMSVSDRSAVADATYRIDAILAADPNAAGSELREGLKVLAVPPLKVYFEVLPADARVDVLNVVLT